MHWSARRLFSTRWSYQEHLSHGILWILSGRTIPAGPGRFVEHQDLQPALRCRMAFQLWAERYARYSIERVKTAVLDEIEKLVVYNAKLVAFVQCSALLFVYAR